MHTTSQVWELIYCCTRPGCRKATRLFAGPVLQRTATAIPTDPLTWNFKEWETRQQLMPCLSPKVVFSISSWNLCRKLPCPQRFTLSYVSFDEQHRDWVQAKLFGRLILGLNSVWLPQSFDKNKQYHYQNSVLGAAGFFVVVSFTENNKAFYRTATLLQKIYLH